jgi:hypothetical protein
MKAIHQGISGQLPGYRRPGDETPYLFSAEKTLKTHINALPGVDWQIAFSLAPTGLTRLPCRGTEVSRGTATCHGRCLALGSLDTDKARLIPVLKSGWSSFFFDPFRCRLLTEEHRIGMATVTRKWTS